MIVREVNVDKVFVNGPDVLVWVENLHGSDTDTISVATWIHVEDDKISAIGVASDPRFLFQPDS